MTDEELDSLIAGKFRDYRETLPDAVRRRLANSIHRSHLAKRTAAIACVAALCAACCGTLLVFTRSSAQYSEPPAMIAAQKDVKPAKASYLVLLGYLKECFRQTRTPRKEEEDEFAFETKKPKGTNQ